MVCVKHLSFQVAGLGKYASRYWVHHVSNSHRDQLAVLIPYLHKQPGSVIQASTILLDPDNRRNPRFIHVLAGLGLANCIMSDCSLASELEARDSFGWTPLFYAIGHRHLECLKDLLRRGADPNTKDNWGQTPLGYACQHGFRETVDILLSAGADVNLPGRYGRTPLYCTAREDLSRHWRTSSSPDPPPIATALIRAGAKIDLPDESGATPLIDAIHRRDAYTAIFLINQVPN
jgi:uncharacterized protein